MKKIFPKCYNDFGQTYIEVNGLVTPCCWICSSNTRANLLKRFFGDEFNKLFITESSLKEIRQTYRKLEDTWDTDQPFITCLEECGDNKNV